MPVAGYYAPLVIGSRSNSTTAAGHMRLNNKRGHAVAVKSRRRMRRLSQRHNRK